MTLEEIQTKLDHERRILEIKYQTAATIRKALQLAELDLTGLDEEYDEDEILTLVTDDA